MNTQTNEQKDDTDIRSEMLAGRECYSIHTTVQRAPWSADEYLKGSLGVSMFEGSGSPVHECEECSGTRKEVQEGFIGLTSVQKFEV